MNNQLAFQAMLPEHLLLVGIVLMLTVEIVGGYSRAALLLAVASVAAAAGVAVSMYVSGFSGAPFPGQFSVAPSTLLAKAVVLGLSLPVLLMSRDDFGDGGGLFGASHPGRFNVVLADGSVRAISYTIAKSVFANLGNRADGNVVRSLDD